MGLFTIKNSKRVDEKSETSKSENGKYVENIEFFSRDSTRVGHSLEFDFEIKEGDWHHKGFSSKGDPKYEIWTQRQE